MKKIEKYNLYRYPLIILEIYMIIKDYTIKQYRTTNYLYKSKRSNLASSI
jgi:hypothetical protein